MKGNTPSAKTINTLKNDGYIVANVEKVIPRCFIKQDLYGFIDILAIHKQTFKMLGLQTTSRSNHNARLDKALSLKNLYYWLMTGASFQVWSWGKYKIERGSRKTEERIHISDISIDNSNKDSHYRVYSYYEPHSYSTHTEYIKIELDYLL